MANLGRKFSLYVVSFLTLFAFPPPSISLRAQVLQFVTTTFNSNPLGASVIIDSQAVGSTPLTLPLSLGLHHIRLSLPKHNNWQGDYVMYGSKFNFFADFLNAFPNSAQLLQSERDSRFINLSNRIGLTYWSTSSNKLLFTSDESELNPSYRYLYDIDAQTLQSDPTPFGVVEDDQIRRNLGIPSIIPNDVFTAAYVSPSKRYVMFFPRSGTNTVAIYDSQTKQILRTDFNIDPAFHPIWSTQETIAWMGQSTLSPIVILIMGNQTKTVNLHDFKTQSGETVSMADGGMYTRPSDQGYAIIWGQNTNEPYISSHPWLVNLTTGVGVPIPLKNLGTLHDVLFSPDGTWIYAATSIGIQRMRANDFNDVEIVTTDVSDQMAQDISISYTLEYALVSRSGANTNVYLYKMPRY